MSRLLKDLINLLTVKRVLDCKNSNLRHNSIGKNLLQIKLAELQLPKLE